MLDCQNTLVRGGRADETIKRGVGEDFVNIVKKMIWVMSTLQKHGRIYVHLYKTELGGGGILSIYLIFSLHAVYFSIKRTFSQNFFQECNRLDQDNVLS